MATITFNPPVAVDFTTPNTTRSTIDSTSATTYDFDSSDGSDIDMQGADLSVRRFEQRHRRNADADRHRRR